MSSLASQLRSTSRPPASGLGAFFSGSGCFVTGTCKLPNLGDIDAFFPSVAPTAASVTRGKLNHRVSRLSLRSHYWGVLVVVVAAGDLNAEGAELLDRYLRRVQLDNDVLVDLWDVTGCDSQGVSVLEEAKSRADADSWGFAVVADPKGPCTEALEANNATSIVTYADRHAARSALQR
jgi:anti-anti-sigma regulatory factor